MKNLHRVLTAASAAIFMACMPALAQWQVPDHSVPIGRGSGTGFKFAAPGASGIPLVSSGAATDPSFAPLSLTAGVTGILPGANGGTNNAFMQFTGPATTLKTYALPNVSDTIGVLGVAQTWSAAQTYSAGLSVNNGSSAVPAIRAPDADTGFSFGVGEINQVLNGTAFMSAFDSGADGKYFGLTANLTAAFPPCRIDQTGDGLLRCHKVIIAHAGDTPEYGYYGIAGSTAAPTNWAANNQGNQMSISYTTLGAPQDGNPTNLVLANNYRLILPCLLGAGPAYTCTRYQPSAVAYVDGMTFQLRFNTAASAATPTLNWNGWGVRDVYRADCTTVPGASYWNLNAEISVRYVLATTRFCATSDSDLPAGRTDRAGFANPNWGRSTNTVTRMSQVPQQTSRAASYAIETTAPGESVLRTRLSVSEIGSTVVLARGSYEDGPTANGLTQQDYYPGPMNNVATDCYYFGQYFAGLCGPRNAFNTAGFGSLSVLASDNATSWAAIGVRKSTEISKGIDHAYDFSTDTYRFIGRWPAGGSNAIATLTEANGRCRITTAAPHGRSRYVLITTSGYSPTGDDTPNGIYTGWPVSTTEIELLGSKCANSYGAGGVYDVASSSTWGSLHPQTGKWTFGGADGSHDFSVTHTASAVNAWNATGAATGNGPTLSVVGSDTNINANIDSKGTGLIALNPGGTVGVRVNRVASAVNFLEIDPAATAGHVRISSAGTDSDVRLQLRSKGTARIELMPGGVETVRIPQVASAVNVFELKGSATGQPVDVEAGGSDTNVDLRFVPRGTTGRVRFGTFVGTGDNAMTGYIEVRDAGGTLRRLMVCGAC